MKKSIFLIALGTIGLANLADAAINVSIQQSGTSLVVSSSGTLNPAVCTSTSAPGTSTSNDVIPTVPAELAFGAVGSQQQQCVGTTITPTTGFGSGSGISGPTNTGISYYFSPTIGFWGPNGWNGSTPMTSTMTFPSTSIASAGLTVGTYVYTFTNGGASDTYTINIVNPTPAASSIPTLSDWSIAGLMLIMSFLGLNQILAKRKARLK